MHRRFAHRDRSRGLHAAVPESRRAREILRSAIGITDPEIAPARRLRNRRYLISERRRDGGEVGRDRHLRDEQNRIGERDGEQQRFHSADYARQPAGRRAPGHSPRRSRRGAGDLV
jgi:hypothetical protein